ncbi:MAG: phosphoenolpyruvate carboxylase [Pseudohongiella sp.]|nr:MAG: phosphoenolpyruvate carboxylase [Pseudohongiella sp.]
MSDSLSNKFEELIGLNYQLYNGLFLTLPLDAVEKTGLLLPLLDAACQQGLAEGKTPDVIVEEFFDLHKPHFSELDKNNFLFKVIQYVERQVVLVDALEDAAYRKMHQVDKLKILQSVVDKVETDKLDDQFSEILRKFGIRVTLTAHPTQFYPGPVLAIINDLTRAIAKNDNSEVRNLLQQLGNTPFSRKSKPSPYDEAVLLSWYLGNIFYPVMGQIIDKFAGRYERAVLDNQKLMTIGFWPGGDRDGNPFVNVDTTRRVAAKLRYGIASCYHRDIRDLKRRLTFKGTYEILDELEKQLHDEMSESSPIYTLDAQTLIARLDEIETLLVEDNQGLFVEKLRSFRRKVYLFGFYFASLDIRQDSRVINRAFDKIVEENSSLFTGLEDLGEAEQVDKLLSITGSADMESIDEAVMLDTVGSFSLIDDIQAINGEQGCHRYIISNCHGPIDMARVYALFQVCGWQDKTLSVDIVPLFESINDLKNAGEYMRSIYANPNYKSHLNNRGNRQTIMLGFSDGTKDGGYLMANWAIYKAKEDLTAVSREAGIEVIFFDGRGGPTARGGGNAYLFYAALGKKIESNEIQMTVQGQTISSNYGVKPAAQHNLSLLLAAGLENNLYDRPERELNEAQNGLIDSLASTSLQKYESLKQHELFLPYLEEMSTLNYYNMTNIGSRPAKRGDSSELKFEDLRAIPFVGAWAQLKQNVPGYYGLGTALAEQDEAGQLDKCIQLYKDSGFFRALIANGMQNLAKTNFDLTRYMENDERFGEFWKMIYTEHELTHKMVLKVAQQDYLLEDNPRARLSIELRERIVLPLLVTQQFALMKINEYREQDEDDPRIEDFEKMVVRSLYGNINASRNSA